MTDVAKRLESLIAELGTLGSPIGRYLSPGRTEADVRAALNGLDLAPPAELIDWYTSHDGVDHVAAAQVEGDRSPLELFFSVTPLSLNESVGVCQEQRAMLLELFDGADPEADLFWRDPWFPILLGPGSIFAVDCGRDPTTEVVPVWRALSHPGPFVTGIVAASLGAFIGSLVTEIRAGSVWWHQESRSIQPRQEDESRLAVLGLF